MHRRMRINILESSKQPFCLRFQQLSVHQLTHTTKKARRSSVCVFVFDECVKEILIE